jgi:hypothetical protein
MTKTAVTARYSNVQYSKPIFLKTYPTPITVWKRQKKGVYSTDEFNVDLTNFKFYHSDGPQSPDRN